ncbi:MAG: cation transporter [Gammaproteobacteria bacterium]|nr:cation transporter [Gammaproteobacteria bacterium]
MDIAENTKNTDSVAEYEAKNRYQIIKKVTLIGGVVNLILAVIKMLVGKIAFSHALFVDGVHSLSDLLSDILVLYAAKKGHKSADEDHPYGHARIETFYTVVFGFILISVGLGILFDAISILTEGEAQPIPTPVALIVAVVSVVSKEVLYQYTLYYAKKVHSSILKANAWHHRSDAVSSIVVLVGVLGSMYGIPYLDLAAAIIVAMMIAKIGWELVYESVNELVDKGLDQEELERIKNVVEKIPGIVHMHSLRTRQMGGKTLVDIHIQVFSRISVSEGHRISDEVQQQLTKEIESISQVLVHVDPEDDEDGSPSYLAPLRDEMITRFQIGLGRYYQTVEDNPVVAIFKQKLDDLMANQSEESLFIHYNYGIIELEIFFTDTKLFAQPRLELEQLKDFEKQLNEFFKGLDCKVSLISFGLKFEK